MRENLSQGRWDIRCPEDDTPAEVLPSEEGDTLLPVSPYGISKMAADQITLTIGRQLAIPSVALRYAMVSGAYPSMRGIYPNAVQYFTEKALKNEPIVLREDGNQSRDFVDIHDLGKAHLAVLDNPAAYYQAFNVGSGKSVKIVDLARLVYRIVGVDFRPVFRNEFRPFTPRAMMMSIAKAQRLLSWSPAYPLEESVRDYVAAVKLRKSDFGIQTGR